MTEDNTGTIETKAQEATSTERHVQLWIDAIDLSSKSEKDWRKKVTEVYKTYRDSEERKTKALNILFANTQTLAPAIYNSPPIPDIRKRYGDADSLSQHISQALERAVTYSIDSYDVDAVLKAVVLDGCLAGRGVPRVRYEPILVPNPALQDPAIIQNAMMQGLDPQQVIASMPQEVVGQQKVSCELVQWDDVRFGPAKVWSDVPWTAFKHLMTRDQLVKLSPEYGPLVNLDQTINGSDEDKAKESPDLFKRALVWEIWDKESKEKLFVAPSFTKDFLSRGKPEFNLDGFYPIPRPFYAIFSSTTLEPIEPYRMYKDLAEELNEVTKRISKLIKVLKWRGISADEYGIAGLLKDADDGEIVPASNTANMVAAGKTLESAIYFMPIERLVEVIKNLYVQRDNVKQAIYEITGISDILRGASKATETLGAQQIKAQWGSLRISDMQKEAERIARDLIRMMVEVFAEKVEPEILQLMTGIQLTPDEVNIMRSDVLRTYKIDVETDSTIRGDLNRAQQNISQFVQGFGGFITSVGPAVQSGLFPLPTAIKLLTSFARAFKLGRQAEDALEDYGKQAEQGMIQPQMPTAGMPPQGAPQGLPPKGIPPKQMP